MSASEAIINEQALTDVASGIQTFLSSYKEAIESAIRGIQASGSEWNDEDYQSLLSAISSFQKDIESLGTATHQLVVRINRRIEAIHVLHSMKI